MEKDWVKIYITKDNFEAEILKGLFDTENIDSVILNKKDSSIIAFGEIELYTHIDNAERAKKIIENNKD